MKQNTSLLVNVYNNSFSEITFVIDYFSSKDEVRLKPGTYQYPFENELQASLPSSFIGKFGHIRYRVCVVHDSESRWFDKEFEKPFTIIKTVDLNLDPIFRVMSFLWFPLINF